MQETDKKGAGHSKRTLEGKLLPLLAGVAVILILLILLVLRNTRLREQKALEEASVLASVEESRSVEASIEESLEESREAEKEKIKLSECDIPEIGELIQQYFDLRLTADAEGLYLLFGRDTSRTPVDEDFAAKLTAQKSWVRSFDDIQIYLLPGENENERLGIVTYKINFRRVNTKAPAIMYFYAVKQEDGSWRLDENLLKDTRDLITEEFEEAGVQMLIDDNTASLKKALEEDSDLALMYVSFMNGEIYADYNLDPDREQQIDLFADPEDSILVGE